jgi:histidinol-phosphate/aromatic aminotransferase/cobyric acid decarboxylase-like protein
MERLRRWTMAEALAARARSSRTRAKPFVDLSTGINPHSYPLFDLPATALSRLPEAARAGDLADVAAKSSWRSFRSECAPAPGTQILLARVASLVSPGKALVLGPTYAEHRRVAAIAGHAATKSTISSRLPRRPCHCRQSPTIGWRVVDRESPACACRKIARQRRTAGRR